MPHTSADIEAAITTALAKVKTSLDFIASAAMVRDDAR
jgi:hypothetical protein